jgi:hypothetical protein
MDEKWVLTIMGFDKMGLDKTLDLAKKWLGQNGTWQAMGIGPKMGLGPKSGA